MRAYHWTFLLWVLLSPAILATRDSIGYELLSQYFAYKLEARTLGPKSTKIAFGCPGSSQNEGICTFLEFVRHVSVLTTRQFSKTITIHWDYAYIGPGGADTIQPDISEVGKTFQNYAQPRNSYTFENVNAKALHRDFESKNGKMSLRARLNSVFKSVEDLKLRDKIPDNDPDLIGCRDAAQRSSRHRALDIEKSLVSTLQQISTAEIDVGGGNRETITIKVKTRTEVQDGKSYTVSDIGATIRESGGTTPDRMHGIRAMVRGVRQGRMPQGSKEPHLDLQPLASHVNALQDMENYVSKLTNLECLE